MQTATTKSAPTAEQDAQLRAQGLDPKRLAFYRWLYATGRLTDGR